MNELQATFDAIQAREAVRNVARETAASANRARMRAWSPEFSDFCESLKAAGMFGRLIQFQVHPSP